MRTPLLTLAAATIGLVAVAYSLNPTPSGACSFAHPCDDLEQSEPLTLLEVVAVDGSLDESPHDFHDATLDFNGWGDLQGVTTPTGYLVFWGGAE